MSEWTFMIDPAWQPADEDDEPPFEAVVGGWFLRDDGEVSLFRPNPGYQPSRPGLPTDPADAALQRLAAAASEDVTDGATEDATEGAAEDATDGANDTDRGEALLSALAEVLLGVAVDEQGIALVVPAPDGVPSVLVTTAPPHRARVDTPAWREVTVTELAVALPPQDVDVLLNPGAPASTRLTADAVRSVARPAR
ncbi:hypothetical protein [Actinophytocola sp.]|uniref:hypothetical protein n=1 Tax=Actinophytocola sp. TaxID=1872138 RepID=UPI00389B3280